MSADKRKATVRGKEFLKKAVYPGHDTFVVNRQGHLRSDMPEIKWLIAHGYLRRERSAPLYGRAGARRVTKMILTAKGEKLRSGA